MYDCNYDYIMTISAVSPLPFITKLNKTCAFLFVTVDIIGALASKHTGTGVKQSGFANIFH